MGLHLNHAFSAWVKEKVQWTTKGRQVLQVQSDRPLVSQEETNQTPTSNPCNLITFVCKGLMNAALEVAKDAQEAEVVADTRKYSLYSNYPF